MMDPIGVVVVIVVVGGVEHSQDVGPGEPDVAGTTSGLTILK